MVSFMVVGVISVTFVVIYADDVLTLQKRWDLTRHPHWHLLPHRTCGLRLAKPQMDLEDLIPRILKADTAYHGQFPWMANVFRTDERLNKNKPHCGGTIINKNYILTAAHCCRTRDPPNHWWVRVSEFNLEGPERTPKGFVESHRDVLVHYRISHPHYERAKHNDICLLRLKTSLEFNDYIQPICLPIYDEQPHENFDGRFLEIAGWGRTEKGVTSPKLQFENVPGIPQETCQEWFEYVGHKEICAGGRLDGVNIGDCKGDSGGPLMASYEVEGRTKYFQFGVVSYGSSECDTRQPTVFARVSEYLDWILNNIRQ